MTDLLTPEQIDTLRQRAERAEAALDKALKIIGEHYPDVTGGLVQRIDAVCTLGHMAHDAQFAAQSTIAELTATVERTDKERIELAKMLLHYVRSVPIGNQPHMSAEIAEKMALVALGEP